jgi:hypothetical protein
MKYLIIAETENVGYFVEINEEYEFAINREKHFFELAFNPPTDHKKMLEKFIVLGPYLINYKFAISIDFNAGSSNSIYSTYLLEIDENFGFDALYTLRNKF